MFDLRYPQIVTPDGEPVHVEPIPNVPPYDDWRERELQRCRETFPEYDTSGHWVRVVW